MFGRGFKIATIGGVPLRLDTSFLWIAALILYSQYVTFTRIYGLDDAQSLGFALISTVLFFGSILIHEGAHAVAGRSLGLPVRGITLIFWGGFTEVQADKKGARGELFVSAVGPLSSLLLGGLFKLAELATSDPVWSGLFGYLAYINTLVAVLNALPGLPLDGGRVLLASVWGISRRRETGERVAAVAGTIVGWALIAGAVFLLFTRGDFGFVFFLGFVGWTMIANGRQSEQRLALRSGLRQGRVRDAMRPPPATIPADLSLSETLDGFLRGRETESFPVAESDGRVVGLISFDSARKLGAKDPLRPARDGMQELSAVPVVEPDESLEHALATLGSRTGLVMDRDRLVGAIGPEDLESWLRRRQGYGDPTPAVPPAPVGSAEPARGPAPDEGSDAPRRPDA